MFTVKELLEALEQCPGDCVVWIDHWDVEGVEIDYVNNIVNLFT